MPLGGLPGPRSCTGHQAFCSSPCGWLHYRRPNRRSGSSRRSVGLRGNRRGRLQQTLKLRRQPRLLLQPLTLQQARGH